jgi:hypothetical protein
VTRNYIVSTLWKTTIRKKYSLILERLGEDVHDGAEVREVVVRKNQDDITGSAPPLASLV